MNWSHATPIGLFVLGIALLVVAATKGGVHVVGVTRHRGDHRIGDRAAGSLAALGVLCLVASLATGLGGQVGTWFGHENSAGSTETPATSSLAPATGAATPDTTGLAEASVAQTATSADKTTSRQQPEPPSPVARANCSDPFTIVVDDSENKWVAPRVVELRANIQVTAWASGPCGSLSPCYMTYTEYEDDVQVKRAQDDCADNEDGYFMFRIQASRHYRYVFEVENDKGTRLQREWEFSVQGKS